MSEIKFACPHCSQHIACDANYSGYPIDCPACRGRMIVPRFSKDKEGQGSANNIGSVATAFISRSSEDQNMGFWSEEQWREHSGRVAAAELTGLRGTKVFLFLLLTPAILTLVILGAGRNFLDPVIKEVSLFFVFALAIVTSRYCGGWLAERNSGGSELSAALFTFGIFCINCFIVISGCVRVGQSL